MFDQWRLRSFKVKSAKMKKITKTIQRQLVHLQSDKVSTFLHNDIFKYHVASRGFSATDELLALFRMTSVLTFDKRVTLASGEIK